MIRSRARSVVGCLIAVSLVFAAACKKEEAEKGGGTGGVSGGGGGNSDLKLLPKDADIVVGMNLASALQSKLFNEMVLPQMEKQGDFKKLTEDFKAKCNLDWKQTASSMTVGVKVTGNEAAVTMVVNGLDKTKIMACADQMKGEMAKEGTEYTKDGEVGLLKGKKPEESAAFTFVDSDTMVLVGGPGASKEAVLAAVEGKSSLKDSSQFVGIFGKVKSSHTMWFVVNGSIPQLAAKLKDMNLEAQAISGSLNVTDKLDVDVRILATSEDAAKKMEELAQGVSKTAEAFAGKPTIERDKNEVRGTISITQDKLKMLGSMVPGMGGM